MGENTLFHISEDTQDICVFLNSPLALFILLGIGSSIEIAVFFLYC